jgi:secondary thiamine-phosphate synthase enzyme
VTVYTGLLRLETEGDGQIVDLTEGVLAVVRQSEVQHGVVCVLVTGSTAAVTTMEYEPGGVADLRALLDRLVPREGRYEHNVRNADSNAHAHLRASLVGPSETVPLIAGRLVLGTWQQLVLLDFDDRPGRDVRRRRTSTAARWGGAAWLLSSHFDENAPRTADSAESSSPYPASRSPSPPPPPSPRRAGAPRPPATVPRRCGEVRRELEHGSRRALHCNARSGADPERAESGGGPSGPEARRSLKTQQHAHRSAWPRAGPLDRCVQVRQRRRRTCASYGT